MDKPLHIEKENRPIPLSLQNPYPLLSSNPQFLPPNLQQKPKQNKSKPQKGFSANLRAGDWVCLVCNNLNFSFRNECNRCQMQTKERNQMQSLYMAGENGGIQSSNTQQRLPFQDLTNQKHAENRPVGQSGLHSKSKSTPMQSEFALHLQHRLPSGHDLGDPSHHNTEVIREATTNKGFENKLLVTPPKHRQNKSVNIFKEYSDSSQKELPPYRSPEHLPSISPILKKVFGQDYRDAAGAEEHGKKIYNSFLFFKEEAEEAEDSPQEEDDDVGRQVQNDDALNEEIRKLSQMQISERITKENLGLFAHINQKNLDSKLQIGSYPRVESRLNYDEQYSQQQPRGYNPGF